MCLSRGINIGQYCTFPSSLTTTSLLQLQQQTSIGYYQNDFSVLTTEPAQPDNDERVVPVRRQSA